VCWQFKSSKSTGDIPVLPFLTSALNTLLWMSYGMLKIDYTIIYVNAVGLLLQCGYILVFYTYTFNRVSELYKEKLSELLVCQLTWSPLTWFGQIAFWLSIQNCFNK
jgi:uncharacterized protein with PQ loop repeat